MVGIAISMIIYIIVGFFSIFNSISMIGIFIFIYLFSSSVATIIFYVAYRNVGIVEKGVNVLYSSILIMFTFNTIEFVTSSSSYLQNAVNELLVITLIIIGILYIVLSFFNTGYPRWYRKFSITIGMLMLGASVLCFFVPSIGNLVLIIFLSASKIVAKFAKESQ